MENVVADVNADDPVARVGYHTSMFDTFDEARAWVECRIAVSTYVAS